MYNMWKKSPAEIPETVHRFVENGFDRETVETGYQETDVHSN